MPECLVMQTALADFIRGTREGQEADAILRSCVHCGFCLSSCPTYRLLGDELDSPRGRIYLMKQLLEGARVTASTQLHLDRCLTCRACESACPSGVRYGRLLDISRSVLEERVPRAALPALQRWLLRAVVPYARRVRALLAVARVVQPLLPQALRAYLPRSAAAASVEPRPWPLVRHARRVVLLDGCVQPVLEPGINACAAHVLDRIGISALRAPGSGCCGAVSHHLAAGAQTLAQLRRNVDALSPLLESGVEAIGATASACAAMVGEYGHLLRDDPHYAARAARISALARDISQIVSAESGTLNQVLREAVPAAAAVRVAVHTPCTLQHALKGGGVVEPLLRTAGFIVTAVADKDQCCGSAGTYSILQGELSQRLLRAKVTALTQGAPQVIATANIGCLAHLRGGAAVPVRHWVELLAQRLP
ncbi:MAG: glycolate oxidase subunit GlcF [Steroidobacteraceae bacterium]